MKDFWTKILQVPIDVLVGAAVYFSLDAFTNMGQTKILFIALIITALFAELIGINFKK